MWLKLILEGPPGGAKACQPLLNLIRVVPLNFRVLSGSVRVLSGSVHTPSQERSWQAAQDRRQLQDRQHLKVRQPHQEEEEPEEMKVKRLM